MLNSFADRLDNSNDHEGVDFLGEVVQVDPTGQGRFKAKVPGLFEEGDLPWVGFPRATSYGNGPSFGSYGSPQVGSIVIIRLQKGDPSYPICVGFVARPEDIPAKFRNSHTWGWQDTNGSYLIIDNNAKTLRFHHVSGVLLEISSQGNVYVKSTDLVVDASEKIDFNTPVVNISNQLVVGGNTLLKGHLRVEESTVIEGGLAVWGESEYDGAMTARRIGVSESLTVKGQDYDDHYHRDSMGGLTSGVIR